jgi:hypothetical protein
MNTKYTRFALAAVVYTAFAVYLYRPYFKGFAALRLQDLFVANACLASLGCYVLSRRWMAGFAESFFAGAVYGFGPFSLGLLKFHPTAGFLVAAIPWLFCPAVFGPKGKFKPLRILLSLLPFLAIVLFFQVSARFGLYPVPIKLKLHGADLAALFAPLVAVKSNKILVGFYHVPVAPLIMGLSMLLVPFTDLLFMNYDLRMRPCTRLGTGLPSNQKSKMGHHVGYPTVVVNHKLLKGLAVRRFGIVAVFTVPTILAFCDSFGRISPIIWLAISTLCCSVLIGAGMQGLISAGLADRKWLLLTAIILGVFAIVTLLFATCLVSARHEGSLFTLSEVEGQTAKMYILGAVTVAMLFIIARAKLRIWYTTWCIPLLHLLKVVLLCVTMGLDIFFGARSIVDTIL